MNDVLKHRGMDDGGIIVSNNIGLAHRDFKHDEISKTASQPMVSANGNEAIVFDGEIANYEILKQKLLNKRCGDVLSSNPEILLQYYREFGIHTLMKDIDGMYAFVLIDYARQKAYMVRDRAGIKPVYYYRNDDHITFASEIKALVKTGICEANINSFALKDYFHIQLYIGNKTLFKNIFSLEPGKYAEISLLENSMKIYSYWDVPQDELQFSYEESVYRLSYIIDNAVKLRMRSGAPIASTISGGLDSAIVSSIAKKYIDQNIQNNLYTYSSVYHNMKTKDESDCSDLVADNIHSTHKRYEMTIEDIINAHEDLMYVLDMPVAGYAAPYRLLSHEIRKNEKIVLNGDGGDEFFCGYPKYMAAYVVKLLNGGMENQKNIVNTKNFGYFAGFENQARNIIANSLFQDDIVLIRNLYYRSEFLWKHVAPEIQNETNDYEVDRQIYDLYTARGNSCLKRLLYLDQKILLPGLLHVDDRTSAVENLEVRTPLLDVNVMEFAARMPDTYLLQNGLKGMLRHISEPLIPHSVSYNTVKSGMIFPVPEVLESHMKEIVNETVMTLDKTGVFARPMAQIISSQDQNVYYRSKWGLYCFAMWYNEFIS